jgi:hypothetical protein
MPPKITLKKKTIITETIITEPDDLEKFSVDGVTYYLSGSLGDKIFERDSKTGEYTEVGGVYCDATNFNRKGMFIHDIHISPKAIKLLC